MLRIWRLIQKERPFELTAFFWPLCFGMAIAFRYQRSYDGIRFPVLPIKTASGWPKRLFPLILSAPKFLILKKICLFAGFGLFCSQLYDSGYPFTGLYMLSDSTDHTMLQSSNTSESPLVQQR
jgi:hypothetical protein